MKALAGIRDAMWELLNMESTAHSWTVVCRRLLEKPLLFWEDLMQRLFLDRLQVSWESHSPALVASPRVLFDCLGRLLSSPKCVLSLLTSSWGGSSG